MKYILTLLAAAILLPCKPFAQTNPPGKKIITIEKDEKWFGGTVDDGYMMPFREGYSINLYGNNRDNQAAPLLVSTKGRYIWCDQPFGFTVKGSQLIIDNIT